MTTISLRYEPLYPVGLESAHLGKVEVGRIMPKGRKAAWMCRLPDCYTWDWREARPTDDAKRALEQRVTDWLSSAGLREDMA